MESVAECKVSLRIVIRDYPSAPSAYNGLANKVIESCQPQGKIQITKGSSDGTQIISDVDNPQLYFTAGKRSEPDRKSARLIGGHMLIFPCSNPPT
jgi:hypothetical protein